VGHVRELIRLSILQGYDFSRKIPGVGLDGPADHFSDIDLALRINPSPRTSVRFRSSYDTGDGELSFASAGIRLREPFGEVEQRGARRLLNRTSFEAEYRFVRDNGMGIPAEDLPFMFDEFRRVERKEHKKKAGIH